MATVPAAAPTPEKPTVARMHELARHGLSNVGHHGEMGSMGVPAQRPSPLGLYPNFARANGPQAAELKPSVQTLASQHCVILCVLGSLYPET